MAEKKERWGAFIKYGPLAEDLASKINGGQYTISIGKYDKNQMTQGEMFTSNPQISERIAAINKERKLEGKVPTGLINFFITESEKTVVRLGSYHPFSEGISALPQELRDRLKKVGLASRIELRILQDFKKRFPGYKVVTQQGSALERRRMQLHKRGSLQWETFANPVPIQEEINKIAKYVGGFRRRKPR